MYSNKNMCLYTVSELHRNEKKFSLCFFFSSSTFQKVLFQVSDNTLAQVFHLPSETPLYPSKHVTGITKFFCFFFTGGCKQIAKLEFFSLEISRVIFWKN